MTQVQFLVFDQDGFLLAEIEPEVGDGVEWILNNIGKASLKLAYSDQKCTKDNLRPGNRLLIRFDNGLPDWGGIIDFPQTITATSVGFYAFSAEHLLTWRQTDKVTVFEASSPGTIFASFIDIANAVSQTGISKGVIFEGGSPKTIIYNLHQLFVQTRELARTSYQDFHISPQYTGGQLTFSANWYNKRGRDASNSIFLLEDMNITPVEMVEQGPVANSISVATAGSNWDIRQVASAQSGESQDLYDIRQYSEVDSKVDDEASAAVIAQSLIDEMAFPKPRIALTAIDAPPARFADYDVGDIVSTALFLKSDSFRYEGKVRILARKWKPSNECDLEVEVWPE